MINIVNLERTQDGGVAVAQAEPQVISGTPW